MVEQERASNYQKAISRAEKAETALRRSKQQKSVIERMLNDGGVANVAAYVQRIADLEIEAEDLAQERDAILAVLQRVSKKNERLSKLLDTASSVVREVAALQREIQK